MPHLVARDPMAQKAIDARQIFQKLYRGDASPLLAGTLREQLFRVQNFTPYARHHDETAYLNINLANLICTAFADFVAGNGLQVRIEDPDAQKLWDDISEKNRFDELVYRATLSQSIAGYALLRSRQEANGGIILEEIPGRYYHPSLHMLSLGKTPCAHHIISHTHTREHSPVFQIQSYEQCESGWRFVSGDYAAIPNTPGSYEALGEVYTEQLDFLPLVKLDNPRLEQEYFGVSDLAPILDLLEEFNDRMSQISVQFVKHLNAKLAVPESMGNALAHQGKPLSETEYFGYRAGENPPAYIELNNPLITEAQEYTDRIIRLISAITQIPLSFFGINESNGAEKVETLRIRMMRFLAKVQRKQRLATPGIRQLVRNTLHLANLSTAATTEIEITWNENLPRDFGNDVENYLALAKDGIISPETAREYLLGETGKKLQATQETKRVEKSVESVVRA